MKNLLRYLAFVLMVGAACSQEINCTGFFTWSWNNCKGSLGLANGNFFGEFKNGKANGQGTYSYSSGNKYIGEFRDNKRNGRGTYYYLAEDANKGAKYEGLYKDDSMDGLGVYTTPSGSKYMGQFKNDQFNGEGTFYAANGSIIQEGIWENNKFVRSLNLKQSNESNLAADISANEPNPLQNFTNQDSSLNFSGKRIALVVGNSSYKVRPLRNPRNDADDVSNSLRATGFQVIDLRDATLQQMRAGVRQFGDRLINNDVGLVYYSGHGVEVKGRNYFIPVNADIQREDEIADQGLDVSLILEKMNTAGKGVNILIVDACRDDPFGRSFRSSSRGLAQMDAPRGTIIAYATSPGKVASDGDGRNSPYTRNLIKAMQQPNKPIEQVFKEVRRAVQEETKNQQTPWENTSLSGDFYFKVQR